MSYSRDDVLLTAEMTGNSHGHDELMEDIKKLDMQLNTEKRELFERFYRNAFGPLFDISRVPD